MEFPENNVRRDTSFFEDLKCFDGKYKYNQHGFCPLGFVLFSLQLDYACSSNFVINFRPNFHEPFYFETIYVTKFMFFFRLIQVRWVFHWTSSTPIEIDDSSRSIQIYFVLFELTINLPEPLTHSTCKSATVSRCVCTLYERSQNPYGILIVRALFTHSDRRKQRISWV